MVPQGRTVNEEEMADNITLIPEGTVIFPPDGINRVMLMFPNENDAIVFYEMLCEWLNGESLICRVQK
jgi:hypothetical protein